MKYDIKETLPKDSYNIDGYYHLKYLKTNYGGAQLWEDKNEFKTFLILAEDSKYNKLYWLSNLTKGFKEKNCYIVKLVINVVNIEITEVLWCTNNEIFC